MRENVSKLINYKNEYGYIRTVFYFIDKENTGGEWDFKSQEDWNLNPNLTYVYNGTKLRYDDIGNIHYGCVGRVLFSRDILLMAGGVIQILNKTSRLYFIKSNFDDPRDQWAINFGSDIWERILNYE